jgi:hypothetical protein
MHPIQQTNNRPIAVQHDLRPEASMVTASQIVGVTPAGDYTWRVCVSSFIVHMNKDASIPSRRLLANGLYCSLRLPLTSMFPKLQKIRSTLFQIPLAIDTATQMRSGKLCSNLPKMIILPPQSETGSTSNADPPSLFCPSFT